MNFKSFASLCSALGIALTMTGFAQQNKTTRASDAASSQKMMNRGEPMSNGRMAGGYNAPANVVLNRDWCDWFDSIEVDAAFTYWMATQDGMDIGSSYTATGASLFMTDTISYVYQDFGFKPGFKVGLSANYNDWTTSARYTWVRNHTHTQALPPAVSSGTPAWSSAPWLLEQDRSGTLGGSRDTNSSWRVRMDLLDWVAGRPFYQGPAVTVSPFAGLRGAWIRQSLHMTFLPMAPANLVGATTAVTSTRSHSWALGPRVGGSANCLLPWGFRFEGMCAANILYTRYTKVSHREPATTSLLNGAVATQRNLNTIRPSLEASLGLGWGTYLDNQRFHFDLSADYEFQYFWSQNMMRALVDNLWTTSGAASGDLALQGLTVTGSFSF